MASFPWMPMAMALPLLLSAPQAWAQAGNPLDRLPAPVAAPPAPTPLQIDKPSSPVNIADVQVLVRRFNLQGGGAIPFEDISALFTPLVNGTHTIGQLAAAAQRVAELYQSRGYALSFAYLPPQSFEAGVVQVNIVEGHVGSLSMKGDFGRSEASIRALAQPLLDEKPLTTKTFQHQTQLMARLPGVQITASASLPTTTDGAVPLLIQSKHQPVNVTVSGDVRSPTPRLVGTVTLNDPLWQGSQLQASAMLQNPDKERYGMVNWTQQLSPQGTQARLSYSSYRSVNNPATRIPGIDELTRQNKLDVNISHPWILSSSEQLSSTLGLYALDYQKDLSDSLAVLRQQEKIRTLYAQLAWSSFDHQGDSQRSRSASLMWAQGIDGMGARKSTELLAQGLQFPLDNNTRLNFTRISADYAQRHRFANRLGAAFSVAGQYSPDVLPVSERISFGSSRFGRGYLAGEFSGDSGLAGSAELNYAFPMAQTWLKSVEPYLLYEWAHTYQQSAQLRSVSLGLRLSDNRHYALDLAASKPMGDRSAHNPQRKLRYSLLLSYNLDP